MEGSAPADHQSVIHRERFVPDRRGTLCDTQKTVIIAKEIPRSPLSDENAVSLVSRKVLEEIERVAFGVLIPSSPGINRERAR